MSKAKSYFGKAFYHIFKYFVCPFLTILGVMFLLLVSLNFLSENPANTDYLFLVELSSILSLLVAIPLFLIESMTLLPPALRRNERINLLFEQHFPRIGRISIKTRIELKPYLLALALSSFSIFIAVMIKANQTNTSLKFPSLDFWIFFVSYMGLPLFFVTYLRLYNKEEKAIFLLDRFFRRIDFCLNEPRSGLSAVDFENALKSYQKTLPSFYSLNNLKERVRQVQLILEEMKLQKCNTLCFLCLVR
jgi:hypothetical protein